MNRINILELHRSIEEKQKRKSECFERVVRGCHHRIRMATECKQLRCICAIPEFVPGFPVYDVSKCVQYVQDALEANGFFVKRVHARYLYVSWDFEEMPSKHASSSSAAKPATAKDVTKEIKGLNLSLTSSLVGNRPKKPSLASLARKPTGKLTLSLS